jgi:hypothetical protein
MWGKIYLALQCNYRHFWGYSVRGFAARKVLKSLSNSVLFIFSDGLLYSGTRIIFKLFKFLYKYLAYFCKFYFSFLEIQNGRRCLTYRPPAEALAVALAAIRLLNMNYSPCLPQVLNQGPLHSLWQYILHGYIDMCMGRGSAVGIAKSCWLDKWEVRVRVPAGSRILTFPCRPIQWVPRAISPGVKG